MDQDRRLNARIRLGGVDDQVLVAVGAQVCRPVAARVDDQASLPVRSRIARYVALSTTNLRLRILRHIEEQMREDTTNETDRSE